MNWQKSLARVLAELRNEEARLERELAAVKQRVAALTGVVGGKGAKTKGKRRNMSAAARAAISRAAKKRWAKYRAEKKSAS
ncbi:MAG TPA: hypothetical protein VII78_05805 [Myxococcota bacterium]|jgi:hypothetical protein